MSWPLWVDVLQPQSSGYSLYSRWLHTDQNRAHWRYCFWVSSSWVPHIGINPHLEPPIILKFLSQKPHTRSSKLESLYWILLARYWIILFALLIWAFDFSLRPHLWRLSMLDKSWRTDWGFFTFNRVVSSFVCFCIRVIGKADETPANLSKSHPQPWKKKTKYDCYP